MLLVVRHDRWQSRTRLKALTIWIDFVLCGCLLPNKFAIDQIITNQLTHNEYGASGQFPALYSSPDTYMYSYNIYILSSGTLLIKLDSFWIPYYKITTWMFSTLFFANKKKSLDKSLDEGVTFYTSYFCDKMGAGTEMRNPYAEINTFQNSCWDFSLQDVTEYEMWNRVRVHRLAVGSLQSQHCISLHMQQ